ncbi:carbohydrate ABC transporter permease [Polymorphospora rubra]|uniref:Sugar ABC transporter permease n=1 Tax=Polymorphospora rubra TaxID=338584 RepID=A0A810MSS5_9ACTN|nr:sugar ABC transporter permease [Polymorphospora rubra]BCJ64091.1 sugar ABC transporter permease [Polymorphospora rubra]
MRNLSRYRAALLFVGPSVVLLTVFVVAPILVAAVASLTDLDLRGLRDLSSVEFIGLDNYRRLFTDSLFGTAALNTVLYVVLGVPLIVVFAMGIALLLNFGTSRLYSGLRAAYFLPAITNIVAVAVVWGYLYNTDSGLLNYLLSIGGVEPVPWLDQPFVAKLSLILVGVWKGAGFNMIIFLAALQGIPKDYYEAAELDGAGAWHKLTKITIPLLRYATFFVTVTTTIAWIQFFEEPFVMTDGGPLDGTISVALFIYQNGFNLSDFGYASAASVLLFLSVLLVTAVQFRLRRADVEY